MARTVPTMRLDGFRTDGTPTLPARVSGGLSDVTQPPCVQVVAYEPALNGHFPLSEKGAALLYPERSDRRPRGAVQR